MSNRPNTDIAIVGAGLLGRLLAWQLVKLNYNVTAYEADKLTTSIENMSAAAFTAAGMIAPISESVEDDLQIYHLGADSLVLWPSIIDELNSHTNTPIMYQHKGSLVVCHRQDNAELSHFTRKVEQLKRSVGAQFKVLDRAGISQLEPDICANIQQGLFLPEEGQVDNHQLLAELLIQSKQLGVTYLDNQPVQVKNNVITFKDQSRAHDLVLDCRGVGAKAQLPGIRGVRGEVLTVHTNDVTLSRPVRLMHPRYQLYIAPKPAQHFVIGATQIESEDRSPVSVQSMLELCSALYSINPAFAEARITSQTTNLRPALTDNMPRIMQREQHISINGLFRHGYLLAPAICQCLIDFLAAKPNRHLDFLYQKQEQLYAND